LSVCVITTMWLLIFISTVIEILSKIV
jgi:hypothetical protein